jgi:predicted protein tyrosine phosphatase
MNLLFICTANINRSPTAEVLFEKSKKHKAKSVGTHAFAEKTATSQAIQWADVVFCMESFHRDFIIQNFPEDAKGKDIRVLDIPDIYYFNDFQLVKTLKEKLRDFL